VSGSPRSPGRGDRGASVRPLKPSHESTDIEVVDAPSWTFLRGDTRLELSREETPNGVNLIVTGEGLPRIFAFASLEKLVRFQSDMESLLLRTGWTFRSFAPDRRSNRERRSFPRLTERRRWWTDSAQLVSRLRKSSR
jgi:hypothetical protein